MGLSQRLSSAFGLLQGRWQVPAAICGAGLLALALYRLKPPDREVHFDALLADVHALIRSGAYYDAANALGNLLEMEPPLLPEQRGILHDVLATVIHRTEQRRETPIQANAERIITNERLALELGQPLTAAARLRMADAYAWQGDQEAALESYRAALDRDPDMETRRSALQSLVRLLEDRPDSEEERQQALRALLSEEGVSPGYLWWALRSAVTEALRRGAPERAAELLEQHGQRLRREDLRGYYDYLEALILVEQGRHAEALPLLERIDQWLGSTARADSEMERAGFLPAMSRWLRGRIHLAERRPQEALRHFEAAQRLQGRGDLYVAASEGRARALALLERHPAALAGVREAVDAVSNDPTTLRLAQRRLGSVVLELAEAQQARQRPGQAIPYLALAIELLPTQARDARADLLERLARAELDFARTATPEDRVAAYMAAATQLESAADLRAPDDPRKSDLLWSSAEQYDSAGRLADARRVLERFIDIVADDALVPQAMLRLGRACAADGLLDDAIDWYTKLIERFPKLVEAFRARLLLADALRVLGSRDDEVERILTDLIEGGGVEPDAPAYRDALLALADFLYQKRRYSETITRIEDALAMYGDDPERYRMRFMLADAYRQSGERLTASADDTRTRAEAETESKARLRRAAGLFGDLAADLEDLPGANDDEALATYLRLALFYEADCLYALNENASLERAQAIYGRVAARYQGEPASLVAQVQIANIFLRQGKRTEAARAIERARWLLESVPPDAFASYGPGQRREDWDRYLDTVLNAPLLTDAAKPVP